MMHLAPNSGPAKHIVKLGRAWLVQGQQNCAAWLALFLGSPSVLCTGGGDVRTSLKADAASAAPFHPTNTFEH